MRLAGGAGVAATAPGWVRGEGARASPPDKPNLVIIHTDEQSFRTLGCYRKLLSRDQAFVWGDGVEVQTPHIDSIAEEGALCTSYYAASPVCTPSRASFVSGLYPQATGAHQNHLPMDDHIVTFGEILKRNGYATSYVGKWHLDGMAKPGFSPERKFGFEDNRCMINRGHWKMFREDAGEVKIIGQFSGEKNKHTYDISRATAENYATDFLTDRAIDIIERDKQGPFCVMLSIPDPHDPNRVREPYASRFSNMTFQPPRTMAAAMKQTPKWNMKPGKNRIDRMRQKAFRQYFGMVQCIDDNVGKILNHLEAGGLDQNTIVVFTADHGDMMGEHARIQKGLPYAASACVPYVVRYPGRIRPGKVIRKAYVNTDFAPTVLGLMGIDPSRHTFHGEDLSRDFLDPYPAPDADRFVYFRHAGGKWVAGATRRYKLVLSSEETPHLFDLEKDPDELINFYEDPAYGRIAASLRAELKERMTRFKEPARARMIV